MTNKTHSGYSMSVCKMFLLSIQAIHPTIIFPFPNMRMNAMIVASMSKKIGNIRTLDIMFSGLNMSSHDDARFVVSLKTPFDVVLVDTTNRARE